MAPSLRVTTVTGRLAGAADDDDTSLCAPLVAVMPVDSAAISTLIAPFELEVVGATDPVARRLASAQVDLGDGPGWRAMATRSPVLVPDVTRSGDWPMLAAAVDESSFEAIYAFPLSVGELDIGAVDLYSVRRRTMSTDDIDDASAIASVISTQVLQRALRRVADDAGSASGRREVHQATGMLIARFGLPADDALLLLRAHAFSLDRPVLEVAADIVARRIEFP